MKQSLKVPMLFSIMSSRSFGRLGPYSSAAFSTLSASVASKLKDPSLVDSNGTGAGETFSVFDPGASAQQFEDGTAVIAQVRRMGRDDTKMAIDRANEALKGWKDGVTASYRSSVLSKWSALIKENADDIAKIMTLESGKPLHESLGEVTYGTSFLDFYAAEAIRPSAAGGGFIVPSPFSHSDGAPRGKVMAFNEAVGVVSLITPWNFPIAMITRKVAPALGVGCTVVLKPSELTPLTALALQTLARRAGVPDGVFEVVTADKDVDAVGEELCTNPIVKKISFTGSTPVGKLLMKHCSGSVKRLSLELGGNAAFVVFEDADIDVSIDAAMASKFRNAGQTCVCADRFIIHKSIEDVFVSKLLERVKSLNIGHGLNGVDMGPLISSSSVEKLKQRVERAVMESANCVIGGGALPDIGPHYFEPTILTNVSPTSSIFNAENFGPVVPITTFDTEEEALAMANDTTSGLASYFCTNDMKRVFRFSASLQNGIVGVNEGIISTASAPFGGVKESGLGREGSVLGISEYLETKYVYLSV